MLSRPLSVADHPRHPGADARAWRARAAVWPWVHIAVAALAMVATLPGRTHGLGLVTEPLLADLRLGRVEYASINLWATLLGAAFCLPCGWLIDRLGVRAVLTATLLGLGGVVVAMSRMRGDWVVAADVPLPWAMGRLPVHVAADLFVAVLLTRGLGQSALSVVSLTLMGRAAGRRAGPAVAVYSILVAVGFMAAFGVVKYALEAWQLDWRTLWAGIGGVLLAFGAVAWLAVPPMVGDSLRESPTARGASGLPSAPGLTLGQALLTPAFWAFALPCSFYLLVTSGISLFNQSILQERGFERGVFLTITMVSPFIGLAGNLGAGLASARWSFGRLLAVAMLLFAGALAAYPLVGTLVEVYAYAAALAVAGGMVTVIFFGVWGQVYGPAHLGKIQGAAQMLTVLASAAGPLALAACHERTGSYVLLFEIAGAAAALMAVAGWLVRLPRLERAPPPPPEAAVPSPAPVDGITTQPMSNGVAPRNSV
jgi:MFS family permease